MATTLAHLNTAMPSASLQPSSLAPPPDLHTLLLALNASAPGARAPRRQFLSAAASAATNATANTTTNATRRASSRLRLLASASPLAPFLCCKCPPTLKQSCCPCRQDSCPCDAFSDNANTAQQCQKTLAARNPPCYTVESQRRCFCPEWAVTATDLFERVNPNAAGLAIGPAWADTDFHGQTWPIFRSRAQLETADNAGCAKACAAQRGCTQYMYYEPTVFCVMLATADVQWFYRLSGAWQYERRMVDPTEPFGSGECRCNQYRMNRYYLPNVHSQQSCVRYCTVALGCVGVEAAAPQRTWNTPVEGIPELWKTGDLYGCAIVTTHKKQEWWPDLPTNAQVLYEVGEDPKCVSIGGVWTGSERAKNVRCRRAQQSALMAQTKPSESRE